MPCAIRRFERNWFHKDWFYSFKFKGRRESGPKNPPEKAKKVPVGVAGPVRTPQSTPLLAAAHQQASYAVRMEVRVRDPMGIRYDSSRAGRQARSRL